MNRLTVGFVVLVALLPAPLAGADEGTTPLFTISIGTTIWTGIVFVALLLILWRFAWGPILSAVEAREEGIQGSLDDAATMQAEAKSLLEQHKAQMAEARRDAQQIVAEAREAGEGVRKDIEEKARAEARSMVDHAKAEIEREKEAAIDALRRESVEIAIAAASRLMGERLDSQKDRAIVMSYMDGIGSDRSGAEA